MTDKTTPPNQPEQKENSAPSPSVSDANKGTQPLNPGTGVHQKPVSKLDPEMQRRIEKMLSSRKQVGEGAEAADKPKPPPAPSSTAQSDNKEAPADKPVPASPTSNTSPAAAPAKADSAVQSEKGPSWPEPAKVLGAGAPSGGETGQLNRPPVDPPKQTKPDGSEPPAEKKADAQSAIRTTSATRKVPKGFTAQEVWKVIFQGMAGTQSKELGVEVKGLIVVGRHDPNGDIKADLDLSPYNAGTFGVSRQHVILIPTDEGPCIIDLNSTNGTWINGLYLEPGRRYRLRTNDKVELGSLKLLVRVMAPAEQQSPKDPK